MDETTALRETYEHIELVKKYLAAAQIELIRRQFTHDRSKLTEPEWEMFREVTHSLKGLAYGSPEYKEQLQKMLGQALGHHYEHNRHHPEHFKNQEPSDKIKALIYVAEYMATNNNSRPDFDYGLKDLIDFLDNRQSEHQSSINNMNLFDILEMLIDWVAATQRHSDGDIYKSLEINRDRFSIAPQLLKVMENTVPLIVDEFPHLRTQKDLAG